MFNTSKTGPHLNGVQQSISYLTVNTPRLANKEGSINVFSDITGRYGVRFPTGVDVLQNAHMDFETHPVSTRCLAVFLSGVKRPGREADHVLPSSVHVENNYGHHSAPSLYRHGVHRDCCTFPSPEIRGWIQRRLSDGFVSVFIYIERNCLAAE